MPDKSQQGGESSTRPASFCNRDPGALQQERTIQASHQRELQRLRHRINLIIQDMNSVGQAAAEYQSTDGSQPLETQISFVIQDTDALSRSCSGESAMDFQPVDDSFDLHMPLLSFPDCVSPAAAVPPATKPEPEVANLDVQQGHTRGSTTLQPLVSITSSPEARSKRRHSPLASSRRHGNEKATSRQNRGGR